MDYQRVNEIIQSKDSIEVIYNGRSVWIEDYDKREKTAYVKDMESQKMINVSVEELEETGDLIDPQVGSISTDFDV
ncbi:MAG: H-type small acid-soluble spore protein [Bacillota bacterium]|nr:H-type small acid-soluble spore protein [Bacillota bacterium]